jgi:UDP-N-acetylmuramyl pentapeptide synthase
MRYDLNTTLALARTPFGRRHLLWHVGSQLRPMLRLAASAHRRTRAWQVRIVGVTGSFGKTTTATATIAALGLSQSLGSNSLAGVPLTLLRVHPDQRHAVVEVAIDRPGLMSRYSRMLRPDVAVITSVGSAHQTNLGSLVTIQREKARLFEGLRRPGLVVLNGDDPRVRAMATWTDARVVTYGVEPDNDVRASDVRIDWPHGTRFTLHLDGNVREVRLSLLGRTMVAPALAALAVAINEGRSLDDVVAALQRLSAPHGRLQVVALPGDVRLIHDGKGIVETVLAAVDVLAEIPARRLLVLGAVAQWPSVPEASRRLVGERMAEVFDSVILVGNAVDQLAAYARAAGVAATALHTVGHGVHGAVATLRNISRPGDVILVKGSWLQKLERIPLALQGETVGCNLDHCGALWMRCALCPMRVAGWLDRRDLP